MTKQPLQSSGGKLQQSSINWMIGPDMPRITRGARHVIYRQRHPFMVAAGWVIALALVMTVVPCCLIYLGVRGIWRLANGQVSRLHVPGKFQQ